MVLSEVGGRARGFANLLHACVLPASGRSADKHSSTDTTSMLEVEPSHNHAVFAKGLVKSDPFSVRRGLSVDERKDPRP